MTVSYEGPATAREPAAAKRWNDDKKHRCPQCHMVAVTGGKVSSLVVYECCRCHTRFTRWPKLAFALPNLGVVCVEHTSRTAPGAA